MKICFDCRQLSKRLFFIPVLLLGGLTGCAAFNDVVVIDVGDQFRLVDSAELPVSQQVQTAAGKGFECEFEARSERTSVFAQDKTVSGKIRCQPLATASD